MIVTQERRLCPKCRQSWVLDGSVPLRFCPKCGVRLEQPCPSCNKPIPTISTSCLHCQVNLQICPICFRLVQLSSNKCKCQIEPNENKSQFIPIFKNFACLRGTTANNFSASSSLSDEFPQITLSFQSWEIAYKEPLSIATILGNSLFVVSGKEQLTLRILDIEDGKEVGRLELGNWLETKASDVLLWLDGSKLWIWSERWISCVDLSYRTPHSLIARPLQIPEDAFVIGVYFDLLWMERKECNKTILECRRIEQINNNSSKQIDDILPCIFRFNFDLPLKRFWVDRYQIIGSVANDQIILFIDEQNNIWIWRHNDSKIHFLRKIDKVLLLPIWMNWRNQNEFVFIVETYDQANLLCFDGQNWRQIPLIVHPSDGHAVATGEYLWIPCKGGQRWVCCDANGEIISEIDLPLNTKTRYAFGMGKGLWILQTPGYDIVQLLRVEPHSHMQEIGAWDYKDQPFVIGKVDGKQGVWLAIMRRSGKIWANLVL